MDEQITARPDAPRVAGTRPGSRRRGGFLLWAILIAVIVAVVIWRPWVSTAPKHAAMPPQPVAVSTVARGDVPVVLTELGTVTPLATVTVQSQVSGYLLQVDFHEGEDVKKGELLALVDPRPYQVQIEQYEAQLEKDEAALKEARMDLVRYQGLGRQNSIAKQTLEDQVFTVAQDEAATKIDQSQIDSAKLNLQYCHITAPVDGRVGLRQVDAGNYVTASETNGLVVLTEIKPISVIFTVSEDDIQPILAKLQGGAALTVDAYDRADVTKLATGSVETIDNQVDTSTGTVKLRAIFPNADERLFPNEFVNAHLELDTIRNAIIVPSPAVQNGPSGTFVYVIQRSQENGKQRVKVAVRNVQTGYAHSEKTVVSSGLNDGDQVVIDGTDRLKDGAVVTIPAEHPQATGAGQGKTDHHHHRQNQG